MTTYVLAKEGQQFVVRDTDGNEIVFGGRPNADFNTVSGGTVTTADGKSYRCSQDGARKLLNGLEITAADAEIWDTSPPVQLSNRSSGLIESSCRAR